MGEFVESKNQAEALLHSTEKNLLEYGDKISKEDNEAIKSKVDDLKSLLKDKDVDKEELKKAQESLIQVSMKLGEAMYKSSSPKDSGPNSAEDTDVSNTSNETNKNDSDN